MPPRFFMHWFAALALLAAALGLGGCSPSTSTGKPIVLCSIFAYYDAARAIAGDKLEVRILIPASTSPHEYETTAADKLSAFQSALYIKNGLGLDDHFDKLVKETKARTLCISDRIPQELLLKTQEVSLETVPAKPGEILNNPHIWLDPRIQMKAAEIIRDALIELAPADKAILEQNAQQYLAGLAQLDRDFTAAAAGFKTRDFIGFHGAYAYLAQRYGLRQIASIEEIPGNGLSPAQTLKVINLIKQHQIKYIALENALPEQSSAVIVRETGVHTIVLQPLETYDDRSNTYEQLMRQNLEALKTALGG